MLFRSVGVGSAVDSAVVEGFSLSPTASFSVLAASCPVDANGSSLSSSSSSSSPVTAVAPSPSMASFFRLALGARATFVGRAGWAVVPVGETWVMMEAASWEIEGGVNTGPGSDRFVSPSREKGKTYGV